MINGKVIYTPKGAALEYGRTGANFYTGCPHNCEYCYLKRGITGKVLGGTEVRLKKTLKDEATAMRTFEREAWKNIWELRQHGLFFSFTTDPLIKETRKLTTDAAIWANQHGIVVKLLTKNADFIDDESIMSRFLATDICRNMVEFGFTLTGRDDMEPGASLNLERILTMRKLKKMGFKTWASIEPVIDWHSTEQMILLSLDCCDHYKIGLRSGVKKDYYKPVEVYERIRAIVEYVWSKGRTVYLKDSVCNMIGDSNLFTYEDYMKIIRKTVNMDGKRIENDYTIAY